MPRLKEGGPIYSIEVGRFTVSKSGFASGHYGATEEGFQLDQSITQYVGLFGRATAYQVYLNHGEASPLNPSSAHSSA